MNQEEVKEDIMSLDVDISMMVDTGAENYQRWYIYDFNITHNLGGMAQEAGVYYAMWRPEEIGVHTCKDLIPLLTAGLKLLEEDPGRFVEQLNPENGWGNYENLLGTVKKYLIVCEEFPNAEIQISR